MNGELKDYDEWGTAVARNRKPSQLFVSVDISVYKIFL
jgi:hypothetical protein